MNFPTLAPRNIVILFNEKINRQLIEYSLKINSAIPSKVILNKRNQLPHMSIYSTNYPEHNLKKLDKILQKIVINQKPFSLNFSKKVIDMKTIFINADPNDELQKLHNRLVDDLNVLRDGLYDKKELDFIGGNQERKESLIKYGMWAAKELYVPHVSISRPINNNQCEQALKILPSSVFFEFQVEAVNLVERGHDGTCRKIIKTYSFINT